MRLSKVMAIKLGSSLEISMSFIVSYLLEYAKVKSNLKGPCCVAYESITVLFTPNMVEVPPRLASSFTEVEPPGLTLS